MVLILHSYFDIFYRKTSAKGNFVCAFGSGHKFESGAVPFYQGENGWKKIIRNSNSPNQRAWFRINVVWQCEPAILAANNLECGCSCTLLQGSCLLSFVKNVKVTLTNIVCVLCCSRGWKFHKLFHFPSTLPFRWLGGKLCTQFFSSRIISLSEQHFFYRRFCTHFS